jgi:hypothetical protein
MPVATMGLFIYFLDFDACCYHGFVYLLFGL